MELVVTLYAKNYVKYLKLNNRNSKARFKVRLFDKRYYF